MSGEVVQWSHETPVICASRHEVDCKRVNSNKLHDTNEQKYHHLIDAAVARD